MLKENRWLTKSKIKKSKFRSPLTTTSRDSDALGPDEITGPPEKYPEGATKEVTVTIYERRASARRKCIERHGLNCSVCDFNFTDRYGEAGAGFIQVHQLKQLSELGDNYQVDPIEDLRPVCANCHAIIHRYKAQPPYSISEVRRMIEFKK